MILNLQILRGLAALGVVLYHTPFLINGVRTEFQGVAIFFVISGFILAKVNEAEGSSFLWRRFVRVVPLYWVVTIGLFILVSLGIYSLPTTVPRLIGYAGTNPYRLVTWLFSPRFGDWTEELLKSLFFVPYINRYGHRLPYVGVGWTLNLEVFFYLAFGLFRLINRTWAPILVASFLILVHVAQSLLPGNFYLDFYGQRYILYFVYGIAIYYLWRSVPAPMLEPHKGAVTVLSGMVAVWLVAVNIAPGIFAGWSDTYWFLRHSAPAAVVIAALMLTKSGLDFTFRPAVALGAASFSLYLTHGAVLRILKPFIPIYPWTDTKTLPGLLFAATVCILVAILFYRYVELPLLTRLKHAPQAIRQLFRPASVGNSEVTPRTT